MYASDIAFSDSVKQIQRERGSRESYERMEQQRGGFAASLTPDVVAYIAERDSAYLATANAAGQPYIQHRGGPRGFIHVLDANTLAFAVFAGNRQYITLGNLAENDRAFLFLMDYAGGQRIKIWGHARVVTPNQVLMQSLARAHYKARVEQAIMLDVRAWDSNCSQHIPKLIHAGPALREADVLRKRISYLELTLRNAKVAFTPEDEPDVRDVR